MARQTRSTFAGFARLKLWQKFGLIAAPFLVPIAALLYLVVSQNNKDIEVAQAEARGQQYLKPVKDLNLLIARHRGLAARQLNGDKTVQADLAKTSAQVEDAIKVIEVVDAKLGKEFKTDERKTWAKLKDNWNAVKNAGGMKGDENFQKHADAIAALEVLVQDVWEVSNLILDPVAETYYLQDVMVSNILLGSEPVGQLRAIASAALVRTEKKFTRAEEIQVSILLGQIEGTKATIEKEVGRATKAAPSLKGKVEGPQEEVARTMDAFTNKVRAVLDGKADMTANEVFVAGSDAIAAMGRMYDAYDPLLEELLAKRAGNYRQTSTYVIGGTLIGLLAVGLVVWLVTRSITRQVDNLNGAFAKIVQGDLTSRVEVESSDEIGEMARSLNTMLDNTLALVQSKDEKEEIQKSIMKLLNEVSGVADGDLTMEAEVSTDMTGAIADSFNFMIEQLRKIIGNVQTATLQVSSAANEIHASADHLAGGSENQAEQIVHTSAAIDEMAVSIQQVSENAALSTTVAQQALANAKQGNVAVKGTIEGMNRIREQAQETSKRIKRLGETSQEIGQIVQLIDDIADRTSILALNASIQAAAAGDAGRGFAVVAEEVERLAVRSTEATKKIAALVKAIQGETNEAVAAMEKSISEVVSGSKVANQAGQSLQEIEGVSVKLAELIQSISLASKHQARGSEALSKSMGDISQITRQTAAGTKQTADSVNSLAKLADGLRESVSTFRLPASHAPHGRNDFAGVR